MKNFDDWFMELTSDERWFETMKIQHHGKDFKGAARIVYGDVISDSQVFAKTPIAEHRRFVHYKAAKMPVKQQAPSLQQSEVKEDKEWIPVSAEEREKRLKEYKAIIDSLPIINNFPRVGHKETIENGGWLPKKEAPYPVTSPTEAYVKTRHLEYIKANYEPRSGQPLPGWVNEQEYNLLYDEGLL